MISLDTIKAAFTSLKMAKSGEDRLSYALAVSLNDGHLGCVQVTSINGKAIRPEREGVEDRRRRLEV